MGVFDFFGRQTKDKTTDRSKNFDEFTGNGVGGAGKKSSPITVFSPNSFSDVELIIDAIKSGKPCIVHLTELKTETALRVLDMLSGAVYALDGGVYEMQKNVFMFSPTGVEVI